MTDPDSASELERLRAQVAAIEAKLHGSGAIAQSGSVAAGADGQAAGRDIVNIHVQPAEAEAFVRQLGLGPPQPDLEEAARVYLQYLVDAYQYLDLRGMGISDRVALKLPLLEMYVPLEARLHTPEGETWARQLRVAGRTPDAEEGADMESGYPRPCRCWTSFRSMTAWSSWEPQELERRPIWT